MDYNLTLFKDSVRDILLMPQSNSINSSGTVASSDKNLNTITSNMASTNLSFNTSEMNESYIIDRNLMMQRNNNN